MLLHTLINWYTKRFRFPFRGWKYARRLLRLTGQYRRFFLKKIHNGLLIRVSPQQHIQQQIFWYGFYEKQYVLAWERLIGADDVILDIGANIGYYSLVAAKKCPDGEVFCFEPQCSPYAQLRFNIEINVLRNIRTVYRGISDENGEAQLFLPKESNDGMGSLRRGHSFKTDAETIQLVRLDDWVRERGVTRIDGIKMDIEGAEMQALRGMPQVLINQRPFFFTEISAELLERFDDSPADVYKLMRDNNYIFFRINTESRLEQIEEEIEDELVVFLPREKADRYTKV